MSAGDAITDPCLVFALRRESMYFRRDFPFCRRFIGAPCVAEFRGSSSRRVLMLETGVGAAAMETALRWCLNAPRLDTVFYRPRFVLLAGFSGALQEGQRVGDLIWATETITPADNILDTNPKRQRGASSLTLRAGKNFSQGRLLTVTELVSDLCEKRRLGDHYEALAVDMESAAAARLCREHNIPLFCLRVISDDLNTSLSPHLAALLSRGRVSLPLLAWKVLRHPSLIRELGRLARQTRLAARRLRLGFDEWQNHRLLDPWPP